MSSEKYNNDFILFNLLLRPKFSLKNMFLCSFVQKSTV